MLKHHNLISLSLGLLFLVIVGKFSTPEPIFRFLLPAFLIYAGLTAWYNRRYLTAINKYNFWLLLRPFLLQLSAFGIFLIIPSPFLRALFLLSAVLIIASAEIFLGNAAENIMLNETLIIAFGLFFSLFAADYYAPAYEPWWFLGVFLGSALLARSFYELVPRSDAVKGFGAVVIGLFCGEFYWALNFLHFHYSVLSLLLFNVFYFCLVVNYYHLFRMLNFKKIQFHLFLILICGLLALLATPWAIIQ